MRLRLTVAFAFAAVILVAAALPSARAATIDYRSKVVGRYIYLGQPVDFMSDGSAYYHLNGSGSAVRDGYTVTKTRLTVRGRECGGIKGVYAWKRTSWALSLSKVSDRCAVRWMVMDSDFSRARPQYPFAKITAISKYMKQPDYGPVARDANGAIYTTDTASTIYKYASDGTLIKKWVPPAPTPYPVGVTVITDRLYVSNFEGSWLYQYDLSGNLLQSWQLNGGNPGALGLAHDGSGNLYVAVHRTQPYHVIKVSPNSGVVNQSITDGPAVDQVGATSTTGPDGIAADTDGSVVLTDPDKNRLVRVGADGHYVGQITNVGGRPLNAPGVVFVDEKSNIYSPIDDVLYRFSPSGHATGAWFIPIQPSDSGYPVWEQQGHLLFVGTHIWSLALPPEKGLPK